MCNGLLILICVASTICLFAGLLIQMEGPNLRQKKAVFLRNMYVGSGQKTAEYTEGLYFSRHTVKMKLRGKFFVCIASAAPISSGQKGRICLLVASLIY